MPRALIVEDHPATLQSMAELVAGEGFTVDTADCLEGARGVIQEEGPDIVLLDLKLPDGDGLELVADFEEEAFDMAHRPEIVLITGHASVDTAVEALRMGATDYLSKPIDIQRLKAVLSNVARTRALRAEVETLRHELRELGHFGKLVGASAPMQTVYDRICRVAPTTATVLITGESGTGKEIVAAAIHQTSERSKGPYRALNCGAVPANLIESELFGHERGAFTGANKRHRGYFEQAEDGTLLLDEITEMPTALQVKLLRVLETKSIVRVGGEQSIDVNARVIAATNRDVEEALDAGQLREDLYYRLKVFRVDLPPLRDRGDDVILLAQHFLDELNKSEGTTKRLGDGTADLLVSHSWPGNVRELKNAIHSAFILADGIIEPEMLPEEIRQDSLYASLTGSRLNVRVGMSIAEAERALILATVDQYDGNKPDAAETLGISLKTLYNRLKAYREEDAREEPPAA